MPTSDTKRAKEEEKFKISNAELAQISQALFEEDSTNFLSLVKINLQGFLNNSSNMNEDLAPLPWVHIKIAAKLFQNGILFTDCWLSRNQ